MPDAPLTLTAVTPTATRGGAGTALVRLVQAASRRGWEIRCLVPAGPLAGDLADAGATVTAIPSLELPAGPKARAAAALVARMAVTAWRLRRVARGSAGIVVNGLNALPPTAAACGRRRVVYLIHELITRPDRQALLRRFASIVDLPVTVSAASAAAVESAGLHAVVVPNGTAWPVAPSQGPPPGPPIIGCVGALTPGKGQGVLVEAIGRLADRDVRLELVGAPLPKDESYARQLAEEVAAAGLDERVRFLGRREDPLEVVRRWTLAVVPSTEAEAQGLVALEAMSVGVPVVSAAHGGTPEAVGDAGVTFPPGDAGALAETLAELLDDPRRRAELGARSRERVAEHFRIDERLGELVDRIEAAVRGR